LLFKRRYLNAFPVFAGNTLKTSAVLSVTAPVLLFQDVIGKAIGCVVAAVASPLLLNVIRGTVVALPYAPAVTPEFANVREMLALALPSNEALPVPAPEIAMERGVVKVLHDAALPVMLP
jgi:hypothetical protein